MNTDRYIRYFRAGRTIYACSICNFDSVVCSASDDIYRVGVRFDSFSFDFTVHNLRLYCTRCSVHIGFVEDVNYVFLREKVYKKVYVRHLSNIYTR